MNQDFTEKKSAICLKKKFMQRVSPEKKNRAQEVSKKKNSCNLKIPLPRHHFSNGPSLRCGYLDNQSEYPKSLTHFCCCAASEASKQQYKQDLNKIYRRGDEFSN